MNEHNSLRSPRLYTLAGIGFGFLFPIAAWLIELVHDNLPLELANVWRLHLTNPTIWIVDTAPVVLGIFARQLGLQKQAEQALREREELLRRIVETTEDGIYIIDRDGRMTFSNPAVERILGMSRAEIARRAYNDPAWQILTPEGKPFPEERQPFNLILSTKKPVYDIEQSVLRPDGTRVIVSINAAPLFDAAGQVTAEVAAMTDITLRKQSEQSLYESQERFRNLAESSFEGILITEQGKILDANPALAMMFGYYLDEIIGTDALALFATETRDLVTRNALDQFERPYEAIGSRKDGTTFPVEIHGKATPYQGRSARVAAVRDITERQAVDRLKNEFISTVSHELRTPLTSILGSLGLIMGGAAGAVPASARAMLDIAHKNSERLVRLINDILDMEKIESGKMVFHFKPLELMPLIEQAVEANRGYAEQLGVRFEIRARVDDARVNADSDRLMQVLTNLLSNAAKFSPKDGVVEIAAARSGDNVRVEVHDHGTGIPAEFRKKIFQKFAQADASATRQKGGTGLGLSICKAIIEKHHGKIGFESELDVGTTFYFELAEWLAATPAPYATIPPLATPTSAPRILVCENDRDIANLLGIMLGQAGFKADVAFDARQAKALLAHTKYAAMTLDIGLPDQDGLALFRELRAQAETRELPVIFVSVTAQEGRAELNGNAVRVVDWIEKPIDQTRLINAVRHALAADGARPARVLHVEDDPDVRRVVAEILQGTAQVEMADNLQSARAKLEAEPFDLVILDLMLGEESGAELIPYLHAQRPAMPVVIFSAREVGADLESKVAAALVKSRASNTEFLETIRVLVK